MSELDKAFRTLGLPIGASQDEIEEAYSDLISVWSPDRFPDDPKFQEKARRKLADVRGAYKAIQESPRSATPHMPSRPDDQTGKKESPTHQPEAGDGMKPSLYEDIFSAKEDPKKKHLPILLIFLASVLVIALVLFVGIPQSEPEAPEPMSLEPPVPPASDLSEAETRSETVTESVTPSEQLPGTASESRIGSSRELKPVTVVPDPRTQSAEKPPAKPPPVTSPSRKAELEEKPTLSRKKPPVETPSQITPEQGAVDSSPEPEPGETPETIDAEVAESANQAFELLKKTSGAAVRLIVGGFEDLTFQEWKLVQQSEGKYWIDLVAVYASDGAEAHFVWVVDIEKGTAQPLSQGARDLKRRMG